MAYLKDFRERIQNADYPGFLKIWEEYCYGDQPDGKEMIAILESVKDSDFSKAFGLQVERAIPLWRLIQDPKRSHEVLRLIMDLQTTNSEQLATLATEHIKSTYPEDPLLSEKLRLIGLRNRERFQGSIRNFELLTHLEKGNFVFHTAGWGTGEIVNVSLVREELSLEFEHVLGVQSLAFDKAFRTLIPLEISHFYSKRFGEPDLLEKEAKEDPAKVLRDLFRDLGPKTAAEIKLEMVDLVIPAEEWNRWWQTARGKLKKDTMVEMPKDLKKPFRLREKELPHEVLFHKELEAKPAIHTMIQITYAFLRDFPETLKNVEFKASLEARLMETLEAEHVSDAQRIQLLLLLESVGSPNIKQKLLEEVSAVHQVTELANLIEIPSFQKRFLQFAMKQKEDWKDIFLNLLFTVEQNTVRDFILLELNEPKTRDLLKQKLASLLVHPTTYPEVFFWYFGKVMDKKAKFPFADTEGKKLFFEGLLILFSNIEKKPQKRDLTKKLLNVFVDKRYAVVRDVMQSTNIEEVKEYILLATKCSSFSDHDVKIFQSLAEVVHPSLTNLRKETKTSPENILWTTQEGYQRTQARLQEISTFETVSNAKEIEAARALGDLRENAEFKAALEKRDRLQGEMKFLSDQIALARIVTPEDISLNKVSIGTIVICKNSKGEHQRFTLLGPWDADPEKGILSFQSKLAQAMNEKSIGETFDFQGEQFTISDIESYFDQENS